MKSTAVRVDIAALERLPRATKSDAPQDLEKCTLTCLGRTCSKTCGVTG
jgi:hypothetical protein